MNLDNAYILDCTSGTFFSAADAVIIKDSSLSDDERELLEEGSDSQRRVIGLQHGIPLTQLLS